MFHEFIIEKKKNLMLNYDTLILIDAKKVVNIITNKIKPAIIK